MHTELHSVSLITDITALTELPEDLGLRSSERQGTLTVLSGPIAGAVFTLRCGQTVIGRGDRAEVMLDDDGISRSHARIVWESDHYELEDLGSTNGTWAAVGRVGGRVRLEDGDRIYLGNTLLRFALQDQLDQQASRRIYEMSVRDGLTGLYNRRYFDEHIRSECAYALRHGSSLTVLLCDIDRFKAVNDRYGHRAGDHMLRCVAECLQLGVRAEDLVARYGGEELAVLARGIDPAGARALAERIRSMIECADIRWEGERIPVTVSIGLAHNHAGPATSGPDKLVAAADGALYAAKNAGRNRVRVAVSAGSYSVAGQVETPLAKAGRRRSWDKATTPAD